MVLSLQKLEIIYLDLFKVKIWALFHMKHQNHLFVLRRFSWKTKFYNYAYKKTTKVAENAELIGSEI